jgi:prepilin-type N-terminal cleavage/methylation domain-containing protein
MKKTLKIFGQYKKSRGFTLIEMSVVLLIIGILAGIVLRNIGGQSAQTRDMKRVGDLRNLTNYLATYQSKVGYFPTSSSNSGNDWSSLQTAFQAVGMNMQLPKPASGDPYEYYPCTDDSSGSNIVNHFILRTRLEQTAEAAPNLYKESYNSSSPPNGWACAPDANGSGVSGGGSGSGGPSCQASSREFCTAQ